MPRTRRIAVGLAVALATVGLTTVAAPAAQAAPRCIPIYYIHHYATPYSHIGSDADLFCEDDPTGYYPLPAKVEKYSASTGTWSVVATGTGLASYTCSGTASTTYRTGTGVRHKSITAACG